MQERIIKWADSCVSFFINHLMWSLFGWVSGIISLNIPKIISLVITTGEKTIQLSNILSFISVILFCFGIYIIFKSICFKYKNKQRNISSNSFEEKQNDTCTDNVVSNAEEQELSSSNIISDIHFKKMSIEMFIKSPGDIRYRIKFDGMVSSDCVDCFSKSLFWTGDTYIETKVLRSNVEYHLDDNIQNRVTPPFDYVVYFDEPQVRGNSIKLLIETKLSDKDKKMKPYSLFCVKYPIDELEMILITNPSFVKNIYKCGYHDFTKEVQFFRNRHLKREDVGDLIKYSYVTNNPKDWKCYCIEWEFTDSYKINN